MLKPKLDILLNSNEEEGEVWQTLVNIETYSLTRYDFAFWKKKSLSSEMKNSFTDAFVLVMYKSVINTNKIDFNTFLSLYSHTLNIIYKGKELELIKAIKEAKNIYSMLHKD